MEPLSRKKWQVVWTLHGCIIFQDVWKESNNIQTIQFMNTLNSWFFTGFYKSKSHPLSTLQV